MLIRAALHAAEQAVRCFLDAHPATSGEENVKAKNDAHDFTPLSYIATAAAIFIGSALSSHIVSVFAQDNLTLCL